jgi:chitinase
MTSVLIARHRASIFAFFFFLLSCSATDKGSGLPPAVASVTVSLSSSGLFVGQTEQASAVVKDADGNILTDRAVSWSASNASAIAVSAAGVVSAVSPGTATIVATSEGQSGSATLVVSLVPVSSVAVSVASATLPIGGNTQAVATLKDANNNVLSGRSIVWSSSNTTVATVNAGGVVSALAAGTSSIVATSEGKSGSATATVTLVPVATVSVTLASPTLAIGATTQATATPKDANNNVLSGRAITWSSGNTSVASVSSSGLVTAIAAGTSSITATSEGKSGSATATVSSSAPPPPSGRWVSGYWVGYQRSLYPETQVDFSLMTHIIVGSIAATPSGGVTTDFFLDAVTGPQVARTLSSRAHLAGRKAILMLGGAGQLSNLLGATSSANVNTFVANLISTMDNLAYDGIDVDWEPVNDADKPTIITFLQKLRAARPGIILTFPIDWANANFAADSWYSQVAPLVDQLNVMSYGMAGNWGGWVSWHEAALYGEGGDHPSSISSTVSAYRAAGVPAAKLGIGIGFYGACWHGATAPLQTLSASADVFASDNTMSYTNIMASYYSSSAYRWDATARMGYLTFAAPAGTSQCSFVSYDDEQSIAEKGAFVRSSGIGGTIIWTINQGRLPNAAAGSQDPLLKAAYNSIVP